MARGRFISKKISSNKQMSKLVKEAGAYAPLLFTWMIPHLDVEGRITGEPVLIKGLVAPWMDGITMTVIEKTLKAASGMGLLDWYEVEDVKYISFPKFEANQQGLRKNKEAKSEIPENGGTGIVELEKKEIKADPYFATVQAVADYYRKTHPEAGKEIIEGKTEWKMIRARAAGGYSLEDLCRGIDGNANDPWYREKGLFAVKHIFKQADKLDRFIKLSKKINHILGDMVTRTMEFANEWAGETGSGQENEQAGVLNPDDRTQGVLSGTSQRR